jgi:hypothetical protein
VAPEPWVTYISGVGVLAGIASDATGSVEVVDGRGHRHDVELTPAKGFVYICPRSCGDGTRVTASS